MASISLTGNKGNPQENLNLRTIDWKIY
jgi:hypothetical protein